MVERVYADETRPWLQGSRLTAWELAKEGVPVTLNADSAAAHIMKTKGVTWVIVGAERIAANGDVVSQIGTYQLAVCAMHHGVRFMVVAPSSIIDLGLASGDDAPIKERGGDALLDVGGKRLDAAMDVFDPEFDVTPADLIDVIITEKGIIERPDTAKIAQLMCRKRLH
jgi:methylthioribose-1-phosphate isomerase